MYVVNVMYPNEPGSEFDMQHYLDVHMPMGVGLLHKLFGVNPRRVEIQAETYGPDRTNATAKYHCCCVLYFDAKEEADQFIGVFENEAAAAMLAADWPNYTVGEPVVVFGRAFDIDPDDLIARSENVLSKAATEIE